MRNPARLWVHDFDDSTVRRLARCIERALSTGQELLPIYIASYGGSVYSLIAMQDLIDAAKSRGINVATIALGSALSAAADLLACGTKGVRFVAPGTTVMVHESIDGWSPQKLREVEVLASEASRLDELCFARMDRNSGKPAGHWKKAIEANRGADLYLPAEEVVERGLADHVGVPLTFVRDAEVSLAFDAPKEKKPARRRKKVAA